MKFNKLLFMTNLSYFLRTLSIKPRELEEKAGVSKGYISRLGQEGNTSVPGIDFLLAASDMFGISVDSLCTVDCSGCAENKDFYLNFFNKLIAKTEQGEAVWNKLTFEQFATGIYSHKNPLVIERVTATSVCHQMAVSTKQYSSTFNYGKYKCTGSIGFFYALKIDEEHTLFMVEVALENSRGTTSGLEMFMQSNDNAKSNVCCISPENPCKHDRQFNILFTTVKNLVTANIIDTSTKDILNAYIKQ